MYRSQAKTQVKIGVVVPAAARASPLPRRRRPPSDADRALASPLLSSAMSIRELKAELDARGIDHSGCTEKRELIELLAASPPVHNKPEAAASSSAAPPAAAAAAAPVPEFLKRVLDCPPHALYRLLGVPPDCDDEAIKKAYRVRALKLHPDKCKAPGASEAFKRISVAYATLSDPQQRTLYNIRGGDAASSFRSAWSETSTPDAAARRPSPSFGDRDAEEVRAICRARAHKLGLSHACASPPLRSSSAPSLATTRLEKEAHRPPPLSPLIARYPSYSGSVQPSTTIRGRSSRCYPASRRFSAFWSRS